MMEMEHPERISSNSPTQFLVNQSTKQSAFQKAKHDMPLLSLDNTYNGQDILDRYDSISRMLDKSGNNDNLNFVVEPKYDGISIELIYKNGEFVQAITRGDGFEGEDITHNVRTLPSIPKYIDHKQELHLRGEIVMPKSVFERINKERAQNNEALFANPRNAASGTMNSWTQQ